jgi:hypothetical protein
VGQPDIADLDRFMWESLHVGNGRAVFETPTDDLIPEGKPLMNTRG